MLARLNWLSLLINCDIYSTIAALLFLTMCFLYNTVILVVLLLELGKHSSIKFSMIFGTVNDDSEHSSVLYVIFNNEAVK